MEGHFGKWEFCLKFILIFIYEYVRLPVWVYTVCGVVYNVWGVYHVCGCIPCLGVYTMYGGVYHVWCCIQWVGVYTMCVGAHSQECQIP